MKFPNIYRSFTERFNLGKLKKKNSKVLKRIRFQGIVTFLILIIGLMLFVLFDLLKLFQKQQLINFEKAKIQSEIKLWESLAQTYPNFSWIYFNLAVLEFKLKNLEKAKFYIDKALYLDPNLEKAKDLRRQILNY